MKVENIKKTKYGYNLYSGEEKINLEALVFNKYKIKKGDILNPTVLKEILNLNKEEFIKRKSLDYLVRRRSVKETKAYLYKLEAPKYLVNSLIKEYIEKGYLNDYLYAEAVVLKESSRYGKNRIKQILINKGIKADLIEELLKNYNSDNLETQIKEASKNIKAINYRQAKEKLLRSFLNKGYNLTEIKSFLDQYLIDNFKEEETIKKYYLEAVKKYAKKYQGNELNFKVKNALSNKGFKKETINKIVGGG